MPDNIMDDFHKEDQVDNLELQPVNFDEWIQATLAIMEYPATQGGAFCPEWWKHPEAVARFRALYRQYLAARDKDEMSDWWVHHWDLHARALFDPHTGVFRDCSAGHRRDEPNRILDIAGKEAEADDFLEITAQGTSTWV